MLSVKKRKCIIAWYMYKKLKKDDKKIQRRYCVHPMLTEREDYGAFHTLIQKQLMKHEEKFEKYFRMKKETFNKMLHILEPKIKHEDTNMRSSISPAERLAVTLRFLATGNSIVDMELTFRIGSSTICGIVREVCHYIWSELANEYMKIPSKEEWLQIAENFERSANFPNCLGAIDGKHIRIIKPQQSGSMFLNYKHFFSIVLMAIVDSNYNFIYIDVGAYGKDCDSGVLKETTFWNGLINNALNIPDSRRLSNANYEFPYVFVGDEAFALHNHLLRPYGGQELSEEKRIFNYRLTRARRFVECAFGIMANKWRIFHRPINVSIDFAVNIVKVCCLMQNFIHKEQRLNLSVASNATLPPDSEIRPLPNSMSVRGGSLANEIRTKFAEYFVSEQGSIPWQHRYS